MHNRIEFIRVFFISVTLKISLSNHENLHFSSKVRLKADSSGLVDLTKSVPKCGAYQFPDLMALYWKMDYQKGSDKRLLKFHEVTFNAQYLTNLTIVCLVKMEYR